MGCLHNVWGPMQNRNAGLLGQKWLKMWRQWHKSIKLMQGTVCLHRVLTHTAVLWRQPQHFSSVSDFYVLSLVSEGRLPSTGCVPHKGVWSPGYGEQWVQGPCGSWRKSQGLTIPEGPQESWSEIEKETDWGNGPFHQDLQEVRYKPYTGMQQS